LYDRPLDGEAIEQASFATIDRELDAGTYSADEWEIVRRLVHSTADLSLSGLVHFSPDAISSACEALASSRPVVVDSNMIRAGLSLARLRTAAPSYEDASIRCGVADAEVADAARRAGLPRALFAIRQARSVLDGAIVLFGNSPVGLLELNRMILEEDLRPALVVGMPVGFVHVTESKEELVTLPVPWIVVAGRRGGSPLAVATLHALCGMAARRRARKKDAAAPTHDVAVPIGEEAIILLGHGSRVPQAGDSMHFAAAKLKSRHGHTRVEVCFMSRLGPHFPETFERCVQEGARRVIVIPYFLHGGLHIQLDIPEMLQECAAAHPDVRVVLGDRLGYDDLLVDVLERRILTARSLSDVRALVLPPRDRYPVPSGQDEFVPMPPEMAARWRSEVGAKGHA
jgi:cobalt/nickel transport system ATP-binding protein/precorrin-8X/cobalt-precorrin-8 methylmutase